MTGILKTSPAEVEKTCSELTQFSSEILKIVNQMDCLFDKMQSQWEGEAQDAFHGYARNSIKQMEQLARLCKEYSDDVIEMAKAYKRSESELAKVIPLSGDLII